MHEKWGYLRMPLLYHAYTSKRKVYHNVFQCKYVAMCSYMYVCGGWDVCKCHALCAVSCACVHVQLAIFIKQWNVLIQLAAIATS